LGVYYVQYIGIAHPHSFNVWQSMYILIYNQVGGLGSIIGPIVGSVILTSLAELLVVNSQVKPLFFGGIIVIIMMFLPGGIMSLVSKLRVIKERHSFF
jgi:branched-chain amino acid transport system permease protein